LITPGPKLDRVEKIAYRVNLRQKFLALVHDDQKSNPKLDMQEL
jgi:hypothetical protein